jgi:MFS family permease
VTDAPVGGTDADAAPSRYAAYALGVLALSNLLSYVNRNVLFALFEPIKAGLHLTDAQLGWLASGYVLVFSLAALPFGVLGDLRSRRVVIAAGMLLWSAATLASGLATGFAGLLACRALVGLGGAAFGATAQSLAADYFPVRGRALAMGILSAGITLGGVVGIWLGGRLEAMYGWRLTLVAVGAPGFALAVVCGQLRDPVRPDYAITVRALLRHLEMGARAVVRLLAPLLAGVVVGGLAAWLLDRRYGADSRADTAAFALAVMVGLALNVRIWVRDIGRLPASGGPRGGLQGAANDLVAAVRLVLRTPTLVFVFTGGALVSFGINGLVGWAPTFMSRELGLTVRGAAALLGTWGLVAGVAGSLTGGLLADWLGRYTATGRVITIALGIVLGGPLAIWLLTVRDLSLFVPIFTAAFFFISWYNGPIAATIFDVVPARVSATVAGAYLLFIHLVGDAVAFPLVGALSDRFGLDRAVLLLPSVALAGGLVVLLAARTVGADMARKLAGDLA